MEDKPEEHIPFPTSLLKFSASEAFIVEAKGDGMLPKIKKGDIITDIFAGSGTLAKVAEELGFDSVNYDIDASYCQIINKRTEK